MECATAVSCAVGGGSPQEAVERRFFRFSQPVKRMARSGLGRPPSGASVRRPGGVDTVEGWVWAGEAGTFLSCSRCARGANASISTDGRLVTLLSDSGNFYAGNTTGKKHAYLKDTMTGTLTLIDVTVTGTAPLAIDITGAIEKSTLRGSC